MNQSNNSNTKWWLLGGAGCLLILCLCVVAVGAYFLINKDSITLPFSEATPNSVVPMPFTDEPLPVIPPSEPTANPPEAPSAPEPPAVPESPATAVPNPTGGQWSDENTLLDDFSTKDLGWVEYDDGSTIIKYEDNAYSIEIAEADYYDWAYAPVDFFPTYVEFDVWGLPGDQNGTVGLMCQIEDVDNHYYIELDLGYQEFIAATVVDGEVNYLTGSGSEDEVWEPADALKSSPEEVNRVGVFCTPEMLSLTINGTQIYSEVLPEPRLPAGEMGLFVFANEDAAEGYKVFFDNVMIVK